MLIAAWIVSVLLALVYVAAGVMKFVKPRGGMPLSAERTVGALELLGAIGLVVPRLTGVAVVLTPIAAFAFVLLQVGAIAFHLSRGERQPLPVNIALALLALFAGLAWLIWI